VAEAVDEVLRRVLRGDQAAWTLLFCEYGPIVVDIARRNRAMGSYRGSEDDVREVMKQVFERLRREDYRALRTFPGWQARHPDKGFQDWLTIVTVNVIRNYISAKLGAPGDRGESLKQLVNTWAEALPLDDNARWTRPHLTTKETARRILEYARDHLLGDQLAVLAAWLEGASLDDIASRLRLADARAADRLLRAALARLRRQFAEPG
jgi:hypothetical protein